MRNLSSIVPCLTPLPRTTEPIEVGLIVAKLLKFATGLLIALLSFATTGDPRPLRRGFLLGYLCGAFWYAGNCCWIYYRILIHGGLSPVMSALPLLGFSLVLGPTSACLAWELCWSGGPQAVHGSDWSWRRFCGPRYRS